MNHAQLTMTVSSAPLARFAALAPLDATAEDAIVAATRRRRQLKPHHELIVEGSPLGEAQLILSGWAARVRQLVDGRRQILGFLLPGDIVGQEDHVEPLATSSVVALTTLTTLTACPAPSPMLSPALARAYALARAMEEAQLLAQITRLGRLNAYERITDLLLEIHDRLALVGLASGGRFILPLTQEMLADALGLTSVHINRTLQIIRSERVLVWKGQAVEIASPENLARRIGRIAPAVSSALTLRRA